MTRFGRSLSAKRAPARPPAVSSAEKRAEQRDGHETLPGSGQDPIDRAHERIDRRTPSKFAALHGISEPDYLPLGFEYEYREDEDGGGFIGYRDGKPHSESWPSTLYRRAVGPWRVVRQGGRRS